jgi:peptidyl-prolyl cis-trans isomerase D
MTPVMFETRLRQDMLLQQFADGYADTTIVPRPVVERLARLTAQKRELAHYVLAPQNFLARVKLDADAAKQYYDANTNEFRLPEQVRVEYLMLSGEALQKQIRVDPAEVRKYYETNRRQFEVKESRQAAHIFVSAEAAAGAEARQKARARAEALYQQVRKAPGSFAEVAKKSSEDPGSAAAGGDLGSSIPAHEGRARVRGGALQAQAPGDLRPVESHRFTSSG